MKKYLVCLGGKCRELTLAELVQEDHQPLGTQMYQFSDKKWYIRLSNKDKATWSPLEIGGVFHGYRAMALLLT